MGDLISRQTAIDYLMTNMAWYSEDGYEESEDEKLSAITDLINGVPSAQPQRWVPCSERLPEEEQNCLVCVDGVIGIDVYLGHGGAYDWECRVSHYDAWMPLPEPWKGEEG